MVFLYKFLENSSIIMIFMYVDDLFITDFHAFEIENLTKKMKAKFKMTLIGKLTFFFGMEFVKVKEDMVMHQKIMYVVV